MSYSDPQDSPQREVLVFKHAANSVFVLEGADVVDWLERTITADVRGRLGQVCRSLCLDRLGKIHGEVLCFLGSQPVSLAVIGGRRDELMEHLSRHVIMEDVEIRENDDTLYSIHGDSSDAVTARIEAVRGVRWGKLSWLTRHDVAVLVPSGAELEWQEVLTELQLRAADEQTWDNLRIEAGLPRYGQDYDSRDTPSLVGLVDGLVSQTKGCYLGQEVVCRTLMRGAVREQVTRLKFDARLSNGVDVRLAETDAPIGRVTSVADDTAREGAGRDEAGKDRAGKKAVWAIGRVKFSAIESRAQVIAGGVAGQILPHVDPG